jgi:hypothetical protein
MSAIEVMEVSSLIDIIMLEIDASLAIELAVAIAGVGVGVGDGMVMAMAMEVLETGTTAGTAGLELTPAMGGMSIAMPTEEQRVWAKVRASIFNNHVSYYLVMDYSVHEDRLTVVKGRKGGFYVRDCSFALQVVVMVWRSAWRKGTDLQTQAMSVRPQPVDVMPARAACCWKPIEMLA